MKLLLVTDTHLGLSQSSDLYHDVVYKLFEEIKEFCVKNKIDTIVHCGDFFDEKKSLNTKTQYVAHQIAQLLKGIKIYIIVGNHDIYYKDSIIPTSLDLLKNYKGITIVYDVTYLTKDIVMVPWGKVPDKSTKYCFGHFEFVHFKMNSSYECQSGINFNEKPWVDFEHIYSGHFHTPSTRENITYLGSAYPQTFSDVNSPRGYYVWDNGIQEFIEFQYAPKFVEIKTDNIDESKIKGNIVKLIFTEDKGSITNQKIIDDVLALTPQNVKVDFSQIKFKGSEDVLEETNISLLNHTEITNEYINKTTLPGHINKKMLISMIEKLKEEIK